MRVCRLLLFIFFVVSLVGNENEFSLDQARNQVDKHIQQLKHWYYPIINRTVYIIHRKEPFLSEIPLSAFLPCVHPLACQCVHDIEQEGLLEPLFLAWQEYTMHEYVDNEEQLLKDMGLIVFHCYSTMLSSMKEKYGNDVTIEDMLSLYHIVAALPLVRLLFLLDTIMQDIIKTLDASYNNEESFFVWLWHNWWLPPVIMSKLIIGYVTALKEIVTFNQV